MNFESVWQRASLAWIYVRTLAMLFLTGRASLVECLTGRFKPRASRWRVRKVLCFREPPRDEDDDPYDLDYVTLDHTLMDLSRVSVLDREVARHIPMDWDNWKVEIRCERGSRKRRLVVRKGEAVDVARDLAAPKRYIVVSAVLESPETFQPVDITDRLEKYVVVGHRALLARDLFPMDDHAALRSRYGGVYVRAARGDEFVERRVGFTDDEDLRDVLCCA